MKFVDDDDTVVTPIQEWLARTGTPFLLAADPHQECSRQARALGLEHVNSVCTCEHSGCSDECCNPVEEW